MDQIKKISVFPGKQGERLDKFLTASLKNFSRSQIQKIIKEQRVNVNQKTAKANCRLNAGDEIEIKDEKAGAEKNEEKKKITAPRISILKEAPEYLIINKPAGLTVHGAPQIKEATLADVLIKKYPEIKKVGDDPARPGIVHRLDKEASGLLVVARMPAFFNSLKNQFQKREVEKNYLALVHGQIAREEGKIDFPLARAKDGGKIAALPKTVKGEKNESGRQAITEFTVKKRYHNYTLLKVRTKTGRTHQVRVHLSAYGHPLVGDNLYGTRKTKMADRKLGTKRIFLVATYLSFTGPRGQKEEFKIGLPPELKKILEKI